MESCLDEQTDGLVREVAELVSGRRCSVATAESLTGGQLASALAAGEAAGEWYCGGIVAYRPEVKHSLLETPDGPVVTASTAETMACSAARLLGSDYAVGVTGVGGPESQGGEPAGTAYIATSIAGEQPIAELHRFAGEPLAVMQQTVKAALAALIERVREAETRRTLESEQPVSRGGREGKEDAC
ncbi:CinA family protein [Leucobacter sp. GX24907]